MTQTEFLAFVVARLESLGLQYMVVGSAASSEYGEPRFTRDIDIVLELPRESIDAFCAAFADDELYLARSAVEAAVRRRQPFNLIHSTSGEKVDFMPPRDDEWGRERFTRRRRLKLLGGVDAQVASPEDVILAKLWYYDLGKSDKHLTDICKMCGVTPIDTGYVEMWAQRLGWAESWQAIQDRLHTKDP